MGLSFLCLRRWHGDDADPLYKMLAKQSGTTPKWNFYKYLVDKNGKVLESYSSLTKPTDEDFNKM